LPVRVAAAIVNFNAGSLLAVCAASLRREGVDQVIVVDNGSTDLSLVGLRAADGDAVVIETGHNLGYGAAVNRAASRAEAEYLLVLNPDAEMKPGSLAPLVAALDGDPELGLVGPRLVNADGTLYPTGRRFPSRMDAVGHAFLSLVAPRNRFTARYKLLDWDRAGARRVDWISGACFLVRQKAWEDLHGFDEGFFMYMEDLDLCWRAWRAGWAVELEPASEVLHLQGASTDQHPYRMIVAHHRSVLRFASKTLKGPKRLGLPVVGAGLAVRAGMACAHHWWEGRREGPSVPGAGGRRGRKPEATG
jgi:N-acetylglucosaminyl-diphospho-decaprenol L-rhamnosyltransferase